jgi:hypothetical protein
MIIILIIFILITIVKYPNLEFVSPNSFLPPFRLDLSLIFSSFSFTSTNPRHITNLTNSSNRTTDYLTESAAKPEAYQAHYRRISATKAANQKQQEAKEKKENELKMQKESMNADLFGFSANFNKRHPKYAGPHPNSAPAAFGSQNDHSADLQGDIPIGIEPPLSPLRDMELGC